MLFSLTAAAQQTFTPKGVVQWGQGGDRERGMLTQMGFAHLTQGQFGLSAADLNGDNRPEILVMQMGACDNAGCPITALQNAGPGKVLQLFSQKVAGRLAITNEKLGAYNAFASADQGGAIMKDAAGRMLVYPVGAPGAAAAAAPAPAAAAPPAPAPAAPPATATAAAPAARPAAPVAAATPAAPAAMTDRQKLVTGTGQPDWRTPGAEYLPACLFPRCLNMQVAEKTGIGTAAAKIRGQVTAEDATRWCASYRPRDTLCVQTEVANNGTAGGAMGRPKTTTIQADCAAGTMRGVDGREARYSGTWADGPGAGRPKFQGGGPASVFAQGGLSQLTSGAQSPELLAQDPSSGEALAIQWEMLCKGAPAPPPARP